MAILKKLSLKWKNPRKFSVKYDTLTCYIFSLLLTVISCRPKNKITYDIIICSSVGGHSYALYKIGPYYVSLSVNFITYIEYIL